MTGERDRVGAVPLARHSYRPGTTAGDLRAADSLLSDERFIGAAIGAAAGLAYGLYECAQVGDGAVCLPAIGMRVGLGAGLGFLVGAAIRPPTSNRRPHMCFDVGCDDF